MALTATEEALVRDLLEQQAALISLAESEAVIISKLGATKVTLADLIAASSMDIEDLFLLRQGTNDRSLSYETLLTAIQGDFDASTFAKLGVTQLFTRAQRGQIVALTDGATITPDFSLANNFSLTIGGHRTLANPTNIAAGQTGSIYITQDGTGSRTLAFGSAWDFEGGLVPSLSPAAAAVDELVYSVRTTGSISAALKSDVK